MATTKTKTATKKTSSPKTRTTKTTKAAAATAPLTTISIPRIGAAMNVDEPGHFAGIARGPADGRDYCIKVLAVPKKAMNHTEAAKWAASVGGELATREEGRIIAANVPELFDKNFAYWLAPSYAGDESCAWCQDFNDGNQNYYHKDGKLRAFAVRRLPI